jgi:hypothetical protein
MRLKRAGLAPPSLFLAAAASDREMPVGSQLEGGGLVPCPPQSPDARLVQRTVSGIMIVPS